MADLSGRTCLDDAGVLWDTTRCLTWVSKDVRGELRLIDAEARACEHLDCTSLVTDHLLRVAVGAHEECDSKEADLLDGVLYVRRLVHVHEQVDGTSRALHAGTFRWRGRNGVVDGQLAGTTNAGTHRRPAFDDCQPCRAPGFMEGRLCGRLRGFEDRFVGCQLAASYRFRFEPGERGGEGEIEGTIEGAIACTCREDGCTTFDGFPPGSHPTPWAVDANLYEVFDHTGAPRSADIVTWGSWTGLQCWYRLTIALASPAATVRARLVHFSAGAVLDALDGAGTVIDSQAMTVGGGVDETITLTGPGIQTVVISPPANETLLLELCAEPVRR